MIISIKFNEFLNKYLEYNEKGVFDEVLGIR